jgi:GNAT superfamily N-acetyltransferase
MHIQLSGSATSNAETRGAEDNSKCVFLRLGASALDFVASDHKAKVRDPGQTQTRPAHMIERLIPPVGESDLRALARLLVDAVASGAAVSFLAPLTLERAEDWWRRIIAASHTQAIFLVARNADGIVGTVQLHPAWAPNQPHRGEITKLLVHRRARRTGLGTQLMQSIEDAARAAGFRLLTLDTKRGDPAEHLYRQIGWTPAGTIPGYALDPDGTPHDAVILYKQLAQADA